MVNVIWTEVYGCGRCGALGLAANCCLDWGTAALPVPDLIEETVSRTLEDGGRVLVHHVGPGGIAARIPSSPGVSEMPMAKAATGDKGPRSQDVRR